MEKTKFIPVKDWQVAFDPSAFPVSLFARLVADETGSKSLSYSFAHNPGQIVPYIRMDYWDEYMLNWRNSNSNKDITQCGTVYYLAIDDQIGCAFIKGDQWYRIDCTTYDGDLHGISCSCGSEGICEHALLMASTLRNLLKERALWHKYGVFVAIEHSFFQRVFLDYTAQETVLDRNWKELFNPWILERGYKYFKAGRIKKITRNVDAITAIVMGSWDHKVDMNIGGNGVEWMSCTCPYTETGNNCKHMAAVLFAIEANEYTV